MSPLTKVGPPESGDYRKPPGAVRRYFRRLNRVANIWFLARWRGRGNEVGVAVAKLIEGEDDRRPSHGLPEAELTDAQREAAAEHMKREDTIRRARGR